MVSLLEATGITCAIVLVPGHAYLGWLATSPDGELDGVMQQPEQQLDHWEFVETTLIAKSGFDEACQRARANSADYHSRGQLTLLPIPTLREQGITPME